VLLPPQPFALLDRASRKGLRHGARLVPSVAGVRQSWIPRRRHCPAIPRQRSTAPLTSSEPGGQWSPETRTTLEQKSMDPQVLRAKLDDPIHQVDLGILSLAWSSAHRNSSGGDFPR